MSKLSRGVVKHDIFPTLVLGGSSVLCFLNYMKHTVLLNYYKNYNECYRNGGPVKPSEQLISIVGSVEKDLKELTSEDTPIQPFIVSGLRTIHAGTIGTLFGGIIGLPAFFDFNSKEDIDNKIKKMDLSNDEKPIEELHDCFLLTEKAKKFGIAYEILCVNTYKVYIESFFPVGLLYLVSYGYVTTSNVLQFHKLHPVNKSLIYVLLSATIFILWRKFHCLISNYIDSSVEDSLVSLGQDYVEGGFEFYTKALERKSEQLEWSDQDSGILRVISDKVDNIISSRKIPLVYKIKFYESKITQENDENKVAVDESND